MSDNDAQQAERHARQFIESFSLNDLKAWLDPKRKADYPKMCEFMPAAASYLLARSIPRQEELLKRTGRQTKTMSWLALFVASLALVFSGIDCWSDRDWQRDQLAELKAIEANTAAAIQRLEARAIPSVEKVEPSPVVVTTLPASTTQPNEIPGQGVPPSGPALRTEHNFAYHFDVQKYESWHSRRDETMWELTVDADVKLPASLGLSRNNRVRAAAFAAILRQERNKYGNDETFYLSLATEGVLVPPAGVVVATIQDDNIRPRVDRGTPLLWVGDVVWLDEETAGVNVGLFRNMVAGYSMNYLVRLYGDHCLVQWAGLHVRH